jgi:hypothetical protein
MVYTNYPNEYGGTEQGVYLDGKGTFSTQAHTTALNPLGVVTRYKGNLYRYVYFTTTVAGTAAASVVGAPAYWAATTDNANGIFAVTSDYDTSGKKFAGVFLAAGITTARYIWIQVGGYNSALVVSSAAAGNRLVAGADSTFTAIANSSSNYETNVPVAIVTVPDTATSAGIIIPAVAR